MSWSSSARSLASEDTGRALPFGRAERGPPPLPVPLDRWLNAKIVAFDRGRITLRWDWLTASELGDFDRFVPVRGSVDGDFVWSEGELAARGTAGIRLRLGMLSDVRVETTAHLEDPHDLGIVLANPRNPDDSVVCLIQDRLFTRFDPPAGNANMVNRLGAVPAAESGSVEFRYVARSRAPKLAPGDDVTLRVVRKGQKTSFEITPTIGKSRTLRGAEPGTPLNRVVAGLYVSGGSASFGPLEIEGNLDLAWLGEHGVLPHLADDLLNRGNGFKGAALRAAQAVERFAAATPSGESPQTKARERILTLIGDASLPLVVRIRAAEALAGVGPGGTADAARLASLLASPDQPARTLVWQILRPSLPWDFDYRVDLRAEGLSKATTAIVEFLESRSAEEDAGRVFVDGRWLTPKEADAARRDWSHAWELCTPRVRLRTNLDHRWVKSYQGALEAAYAELVRVVGTQPPQDVLPLSVFVFRDKASFATFCNENGYAERAGWTRFSDVDRSACFVAFDEPGAPQAALGQMAKLFLHGVTDGRWPAWFVEGRSAWFGSPNLRTAYWDGRKLEVGRLVQSNNRRLLAEDARKGALPPVAEFLGQDPHQLDERSLRVWYTYAWALHHWLLHESAPRHRQLMSDWQGEMETRGASASDVNAIGEERFLAIFGKDLATLDREFLAWVSGL